MGSQVAVAEVAVVPTFKGFRKSVTTEADGAAQAGSQGFKATFAKTGTDSGTTVGTGFKAAFQQSAKGTSEKITKALEADVAKASRALSTARDKERDAIGKVRLAQAQLNEANKKYADDSSQVIRAQERLAKASRELERNHKQTEDATDDLKRAQGELARAADRAGDELSDSGSRGVNGFRSNVIGGVKSFAGPLIAAFAALGIGTIVVNAFNDAKDFITESVSIASDVSESVNAVKVSYGDAADEVLKLGDNSAKAFGLSKGDLNAYATQFSAFVKTLAGEGGDVAGTFEELVGRGTDFASVFNTDVSDALGLFQSGLAGETEPLRKYGIDLSAAAVEAYALANGIGDGTGELTEAEKVQARYGKLLQDTALVQGDFANTSDELANKNRVNAATWEDIRAKIGDGFLPIAEQLAGVIGDELLPVISDLAEEYGPELAESFSELIPPLTELAKELLPLLPGFIEAIVAAAPAFISILQAIAPALVWMTQASADQNEVMSALFDLLSGDTSLEDFGLMLLNLGGPIGDVLRWGVDLMEGFGLWFIQIPTDVGNGVTSAVEWLRGLPQQALDALGDLGETLLQSGKDLMGGFIRGITESPVGDAVSNALDWVRGFFPNSPAKRGPLSGSGWSDLEKSGGAFWEQWVGGMGGVEPPFPSFPGTPGSGGPGAPAASFTQPATVPGFSQVNHFDKTDPAEAAELANRMWDSALRRGA